MTPPESSWGPGASTSPATSSTAKSPHASSTKKPSAKKPSATKAAATKAAAKKAPANKAAANKSPAKKPSAEKASGDGAPRDTDFTASGAESPADGERITVHGGHMTIEAGTPREPVGASSDEEVAPPQEVALPQEVATTPESQQAAAAEPSEIIAPSVDTEPIAVASRPAITKPPYVPRTVQPAAAEHVPAAKPAPFPRRQSAAERLAGTGARVREWMTDRRAIVISLVPVVAIVGLVAGAAVYTTVSAPPTTAAAPVLSNPQTAAQAWLIDNAGTDQTILVDAPLVPGLIDAGWAPGDVLTAGDAATAAWRDIAFVASGAIDGDATTEAAIQSSVPAAVFGDLEIRRVVPEGPVIAAASEQSAAAMRREFGAQISRNPAVEMSTPDRVAFASGRADERISAVLGALAGVGVVTVTDLPVVAGEEGGTLRQVSLSGVGDAPLVSGSEPSAQARAIFDTLSGDYALDALSVDGADLVLRFPLPTENPSE